MGSRGFKKKKKFWKRIYTRRFRRLMKKEGDAISKGCFRHILTGNRWYDVYD